MYLAKIIQRPGSFYGLNGFCYLCINAWMKVFKINPEFRILNTTESQPQNAELGIL